MKATLYYFSGTGNSLYVAKSIKSKLNENVTLVPIDCSADSKVESGIVGIIYPTYDLDAPRIVKEFVEKLEFFGEVEYLFLYTTSGGMVGNSLQSVKRVIEAKGVSVNNTFSTTFPDNSIVLGKGETANQKCLKEAERSVENDCVDIVNMSTDRSKREQNYNIKSDILGKALGFVVKHYYQFDNIKADDNCTGCAICSKVCPVNNISMSGNKPVFDNRCEMCLRCIHTCPAQSLKYKRMPQKENYQYRHPEISLNDFTRL